MKIRTIPHFDRSYRKAPPEIREAFSKQVKHLLDDLHHPSLHAKKFDESRGRWQARVNRSWRFYFNIDGETYVLTDIMPHPK